MIDTIESLKSHGVIFTNDLKYIKWPKDSSTLEGAISIPEGVLGFVSGGGFKHCSKITHVILPQGFRAIQDWNFDGCTSLVSITIPNSIEYIGHYAFQGCRSLQYIYIPKSVRRIHMPFPKLNIYIDVDPDNPCYCSVDGTLFDKKKKKLIKYYANRPKESVSLPNSVTEIEEYAFSGCNLIESICLHDSIASLGQYVFVDCMSLKEVHLPSDLDKIPDCSFYGCTYLEKINLPINVSRIGQGAFYNCTNLKEIILPESVKEIEAAAFKKCSSITSVIITRQKDKCGKLLSIQRNAFAGCKSIEYFEWTKANKITLYTYLSDSEQIQTVVGLKGKIQAAKVFREDEMNLKVMSMFYNSIGMNITKIRGNCEEDNSFKNIDKDWGHSLDEFYDTPQSKTFILSENWYRSTGIGLVLGWNNYHAIDVDNIGDFFDTSIDSIITDFLSLLGLNKDYPWVILSGSGCGFHIIFKSDKLQNDLGVAAYSPNFNYNLEGSNIFIFERLELRWKDHLVMPPSLHLKGNKYEFWKGIPNAEPSKLTITDIDNLIYNYCGRIQIESYEYNGKSFKLVETGKFYSGYDIDYGCFEQHGIVSDSFEWIEQSKTPEAYNSIALSYIFGKDVKIDKQKALQYFHLSDSDVSNYNVASLISCGFFDGTCEDVEKYLSKIKDDKTFSLVNYDTYDDSIPAMLYQLVRQNSVDLPHDEHYLLFFDTETTGLPEDYNAPSSNIDNWPRLVQLSWIITNENGKIIKERDYIIKPDGFNIPHNSSNIHGITNSIALNKGTNLQTVLNEFTKDAFNAIRLIGHNVDYDIHVVEAELIRCNMNINFEEMCKVCTMKSTVNFCKLPDKYGFKYPKLQELYFKLFGNHFEDAHNSMADVHATKDCYFELVNKKIF
ncbi:MAG: leucine-rich repeat protein [Bacteroidaceae bacterium]|nr:leucine-rich repeat protein [Bacteroidaceae bacterium]